MDLFFNLGFAWISVILTLLLSVIYNLKRAMKEFGKYKNVLKKLNKNLRKYHRQLGFLLLATGLIHGLFSTESIFRINLSTLPWIITILLTLNYILREQFSLKIGWMYYHRILTFIFITTMIIHIVDVGIQGPQIILASFKKQAKSETSIDDEIINSSNKKFEGMKLKDGVYTGEGNGFSPGLNVCVEVKDNTIIDIQVIDHNEVGINYYSGAINKIPGDIMDSQSLNVDTVSGATMTSDGIINAVNNALYQAAID